ncbi:MAG: TIGR02996 domain-containing protein [Myxococcota bacterium]|nr:TIGR02996 domain-containing protein [Myxococcota bacterium]
MGDVFAIVSKAIFEKEARVDGETVGLGDVWPVASYKGTGKVFESALAGGGRIFMVTVRPPDEKLWLLAILESPKLDAKSKAWVASPNVVPAVDITSLRKTIKFESGKGMSQDKGTLGMSLQTPRALGAGDAEKILAMIGGGGSTESKRAASTTGASKVSAAGAKITARSQNRVAALLSAIRDEPDDAVNRQVLADQYEQAGDPDRANFIRSQVARAELPRWDPRAVAMELDERAILRDHEAAWRAELPSLDGVRYEGFERGLFAWLAFDDAALIAKHIETAMTACPITGVRMRWPRRGARPKLGAIEGLRSLVVSGTLLQKADLGWLAKSPVLSTVEELTLENSRLDDEALSVLLESPHLGRLRRLRLPFHQLSNDGLELLTQTSLPRLVELGLAVETMDSIGSGGRDGDGINGDGIIALCAWDQMAKIERLDLTGNQIGETGLTALLASPNTKRLTSLRIRSVSDYDFENDQRPDVLQAFAHAKGDRHFEELDIGENELSSDAVSALKGSPVLENLRIFSFDFSQDDTQLAKLLDAKWLDAVHILSLDETTLPVVKKVLNRAPKSLHSLSLTSSFPRSDLKGVVTALAGAPEQKALQSIDLLGCNIDDAALKKLGAVTTLPALIALRLGSNSESGYSDDGNSYSDDAARAFAESPLGKQLRSVVVGIEALDRLPPVPRKGKGDDDDDDDDDDE